MIRLENWSVVAAAADPYTPPEHLTQHLHGLVYGHPNFVGGVEITTSSLHHVERDGDSVVVYTRSGTAYGLGQVDPGYEAAYPNARARIGEVKL